MIIRSFWAAILLLFLSRCTSAAPEPTAPDAFSWIPEPPFRNQRKVEIPAEAAAINYFLKGQLLLGEGKFDEAVKEFDAAIKIGEVAGGAYKDAVEGKRKLAQP